MLYYLPLEPYPERYTFQLQGWTENTLRRRNTEYHIVSGEKVTQSISTGVALDAHGRSVYALTQTAYLIKLLGEMDQNDVIYMQDLFQPGYEALPYVLDQLPASRRPRIFTHNLAQSVDPDDFTFSMRGWMRHFEHIVDHTATCVFVASTCHKEMMRIAQLEGRVEVVGLAFDRDAVRALLGIEPSLLHNRNRRIVYTSRFDKEKQPHFFLDMVEVIKNNKQHPLNEFEFMVCTGAEHLRSNIPDVIERAWTFYERGWLDIREGLDKRQYYTILANSRVQVNTALQDFVSNTLLESSALGTPTLAPAFRSFPEAFQNRPEQMFIPWSLEDAINKLNQLVQNPPSPEVIALPSLYHSQTIDRVIDIIYPR